MDLGNQRQSRVTKVAAGQHTQGRWSKESCEREGALAPRKWGGDARDGVRGGGSGRDWAIACPARNGLGRKGGEEAGYLART